MLVHPASAIVLISVLLAVPSWSASAKLDLRGSTLPRRQVETLLGSALAAPGDTLKLQADLGRLVAHLQTQGWLEARAEATWRDPAEPGDRTDPVLHVTVREGPRLRLTALVVEVPSHDSALVAEGLALHAGGWASPAGLNEAVERAVQLAADRGHPYASLGVSAFEWDSSGARVRLAGALGPKVTVSKVRFEGMRATREIVAMRALGRLQGTTFNRAAAEAGRERLSQLGLFRSVRFEGLEGEGDWSRGQLVYRIEEPRYNRFEGAIGIQGDARPVGLARLELDNLAGTGRAAALRWESRGRGLASFGARYAEPVLLGTPLRVEAGIEQDVEDTLFTRTRWGGRLRFTLSRLEHLEAGFEQERVVQAQGEVEEANLQTTRFALERDVRDARTTPRKGYLVRLQAGQTFKGEDLRPPARRKARASTAEARLEWHRPLGRDAVRSGSGLALELCGAGRFSSQRILPLFERYPLGGAASLRGHDEQAFRVDRFGLSRLEWRWFLGGGDQRLALFWDHAVMATRLPEENGGDRLEIEQRNGVGFGLRLAAPGGLIGIDYGLEPGRPPLEGKIHLQLVSSF
jgi:outer membrane protein assembly factor BamA